MMHCVVVVVLCRPCADEIVERLPVLDARVVGGEACILSQLGLSHGCCQGCKLRIILHGDSAPLVVPAAGVDVMRGEEAIQIAVTLLDIAIDDIFDDGGIGEGGSSEGLTKIDPLSLACAPGVTERGNNRESGGDATGGVGIASADTRRLTIRPTGEVDDTGL